MSSPSYLDPYRRAVEAFGPSFTSLLWRTKAMQEARFAVIDEMTPLPGRTVADIGAGRADLLFYAEAHGRPPHRYVAVEALPEFAAACRERLGSREDATVLEADFVADSLLFDRLAAEHGVETFAFSGSLNTLDQRAALHVLDRAWRAAEHLDRGALVFNFLSNAGPQAAIDPPQPAHRFDTLALLAWALERTPYVRFRHDYLEGQDATIAMLGPKGMHTVYEAPA